MLPTRILVRPGRWFPPTGTFPKREFTQLYFARRRLADQKSSFLLTNVKRLPASSLRCAAREVALALVTPAMPAKDEPASLEPLKINGLEIKPLEERQTEGVRRGRAKTVVNGPKQFRMSAEDRNEENDDYVDVATFGVLSPLCLARTRRKPKRVRRQK